MSDHNPKYDELAPRRKKKQAYIRQAVMHERDAFEAMDGADSYVGVCWYAETDDGTLLSVGTDIAAVTQAARFAGFWIASQFEDDAA